MIGMQAFDISDGYYTESMGGFNHKVEKGKIKA